ncbi:MAG TPA: hypothetical protein VE868_08290, partial [Balneolaceae bacterium]|nr:hypothetical protein [Balneolaceae bacterium]
MGFDQIFIFGVLILAFVALVIDRWSPDIILVTALAIVTLGGVIDIRQAAESFGNTTLMALGSLYILAAALRKSGALEIAGKYVL